MHRHEDYIKLKKSEKEYKFCLIRRVYGLVNPETGVMFYIGCTAQALHIRMYNHYFYIHEKNSMKNKILLHMKNRNVFPEVRVLHTFDYYDNHAFGKERELINKYKSEKHENIFLTNIM